MSSVLESVHFSARAKLRSCRHRQEAWEEDHAKAMRVFKLEDLLGDMVELYSDISSLAAEFSRDVKASPNEFYSYDFDQQLKGLCSKYLSLAERVEAMLVHFSDCDVTHKAAFLDCLAGARESAKHDFDLDAKIDQASIELSIDDIITSPLEEFPD